MREVTVSRTIQDCSVCNGSGECPECHNSGSCIECEGTGLCPECNGSGECPECSDRPECPICGDEEICVECKGSGKCVECEGSGICPECKGANSDCLECGGTGKCANCAGEGDCPQCEGDGECPECSDRPECPVCGGDEVCPECRGTGKCVECEGSGICPECDGDCECYECEGTGRFVTEVRSFLEPLRDVLDDVKKYAPISRTQGINFSLDYFESYLKVFEDFLEKEAVEIEEFYKTSQLYELTQREALDIYLENLNYYFPNLFRHSFFVATFSLIEKNLEDLCINICTKHNLPSYNDFVQEKNGNTLDKARKYLVHIAKVEFPNNREWQELKNFSKLRNCVVHRQGYLDISGCDRYIVDDYIPKQRDLKIGLNGEIVLERNFCQHAIETIRSFFNRLDALVKI